jgi:hypothetical protein
MPEATIDPQRAAVIHQMLLRLAGKLPDDLLSRARGWLAAGREAAVARAVTFAILRQRIPVTEDDLGILAELLAEDGADLAVLDGAAVTDVDPAPPYRFTPGPPEPDDLDRAATDAADGIAGARGLWRAWRAPDAETPWPPPRRLYLLEVDADADLATLAATVQSTLEGGGGSGLQVEVFGVGAELPIYHRLARAYGTLLWARTPRPEIRIAAVFDEVDASGPRFAADHPGLADRDEARRVLDYLGAGQTLLVTTARMDDVVDPSRRARVPMNFRTDGTWIWTDTTAYYLEHHQLQPDPGLLAHIRDRAYLMPDLDGVALHRAMAALQAPAEEEPAWVFSGAGG